eukprot:1627639-Pyramimonas_sp.AAC.1
MELLAICWGLIWALHLPEHVAIPLVSDSKCSLDTINLTAMPKRGSDLAKLATVIWDVAKQRAKASNQHVYSHNLDPGNTLADNVAKAAALGTVHDSVLPDLWVE